MSRRAVQLVVVVLALLGALAWFGVLPLPFGLSGSSGPSRGAATLLRFSIGRNDMGDRILVTAPVHITYVPQPGAPDRVDILPEEGTYEGSFLWTVIQRQGAEDRLLGEFSAGGRAYRVCEFLKRTGKETTLNAERYYPMNNSGARFRDPERVDPAPMNALFDAIIAEQSLLQGVSKGSTETVTVSRALARNASDMVQFCLNQVLSIPR